MKYTVKSLAKISNVSVRMLHFYDEIDLLKPASRGENGYRYYGEEQLLMLQQILFYRELGISLSEIQKILIDSSFDKITALKNHKSILLNKIDHEKRLIQTIDETINYLTGETKMEHEKLYAGFDSQNQKEFEKYLVSSGKANQVEMDDHRLKLKAFEEKLVASGEISPGEYIFERYMIKSGKTNLQEIEQTREKVRNMSPEETRDVKQKTKELQLLAIELANKNTDPSSSEAQDLVEQNYQFSNHMTPLSRKKFVETMHFQLNEPDLRKAWDELHPKLGNLAHGAIKHYAKIHSINLDDDGEFEIAPFIW